MPEKGTARKMLSVWQEQQKNNLTIISATVFEEYHAVKSNLTELTISASLILQCCQMHTHKDHTIINCSLPLWPWLFKRWIALSTG